MQAHDQITKLHHRLHKKQDEHSIIWYEIARDIILLHHSTKTQHEIIGNDIY